MSRSTYERLKAFCEANNVSMSQLVETRVNDFLGGDAPVEVVRPAAPRPAPSFAGIAPLPPRPSVPAAPVKPPAEPKQAAPAPASAVPMTSAAARSVVE
ncbi:MAG TPA: hypothetical protein VN253_23535, partial [Kofleriaceae bacterium]|nr:hypothetical protein [Kofleriaceae bacterium]